MSVPRVIQSTDTLFVQLWSKRISADMFDSLQITMTRDSHEASLTATVSAYEWVGDIPVPPTNQYPLDGDTYPVPGPFSPGPFRVAAKNPDSTLVEEECTIE